MCKARLLAQYFMKWFIDRGPGAWQPPAPLLSVTWVKKAIGGMLSDTTADWAITLFGTHRTPQPLFGQKWLF
ncbi:hypothetical protein DVH26_08695 [Paenibacillus sp. H1-7]|nr:hypothetical protein DVH26_08695 [Paenibacillus sp. H1-7]